MADRHPHVHPWGQRVAVSARDTDSLGLVLRFQAGPAGERMRMGMIVGCCCLHDGSGSGSAILLSFRVGVSGH